MRIAGVARLALRMDGAPDAELISAFAATFPDQCGYLDELAREFKVQTVSELLAHLRYRQPPETLSMHLCIFMAPPPQQNTQVSHPWAGSARAGWGGAREAAPAGPTTHAGSPARPAPRPGRAPA